MLQFFFPTFFSSKSQVDFGGYYQHFLLEFKSLQVPQFLITGEFQEALKNTLEQRNHFIQKITLKKNFNFHKIHHLKMSFVTRFTF